MGGAASKPASAEAPLPSKGPATPQIAITNRGSLQTFANILGSRFGSLNPAQRGQVNRELQKIISLKPNQLKTLNAPLIKQAIQSGINVEDVLTTAFGGRDKLYTLARNTQDLAIFKLFFGQSEFDRPVIDITKIKADGLSYALYVVKELNENLDKLTNKNKCGTISNSFVGLSDPIEKKLKGLSVLIATKL
jgi:hypothetical protein